MADDRSRLDYHATSFSSGRMDFAWEELSQEDIEQAYAAWDAGKGLIGGDPRQRPLSRRLPEWGMDRPFFRALALEDTRADNGAQLQATLASGRALEIEIGFGRGDFLLDRAQRYPRRVFVGYESRTKAARLCLQRIERFAIDNLWVSDDDCRFNMPRVIPDGRTDAIHVLFPDPWWKPQHRVKRLFSPPFVDLVANKLRPGGLLHFKSDVGEYGEYVGYLVERHPDFSANDPALAVRIGEHVPTHREFWCQQHDKPVHTYLFEKIGGIDG